MKKYIEYLDFFKKPIPLRDGVVKCDNRKTIDGNLKEALESVPPRARFMQLLIGKNPNVAKPFLNPVPIYS